MELTKDFCSYIFDVEKPGGRKNKPIESISKLNLGPEKISKYQKDFDKIINSEQYIELNNLTLSQLKSKYNVNGDLKSTIIRKIIEIIKNPVCVSDKLNVEECSYILKQKAKYTRKGLSLEILKKEVKNLNLSDDEIQSLLNQYHQIEETTEYKELKKLTIEKLNQLCIELDTKITSSSSKGIIIRKIIKKNSKLDFNFKYIFPLYEELDIDQKKFVDEELDYHITLVYAGPGSGKTTSLLHKAHRLLLSDPESLICIITFNVKNEDTLKTRAKNLFKSKNNLKINTFHKLASHIIDYNPLFGNKSYSQIIKEATKKVEQSENMFDYLFIDESHDIQDELLYFSNELIKKSRHVVLIGDPKQEIQESTYFSNQLKRLDVNKFYLTANHRSCAEIIDFLNNFSEKFFSDIHSEQTIPNVKNGKIKTIKSSYSDQYKYLAQELMETEHDDILIVAPVSIEKYGIQNIIESTNAVLSQNNSSKKISIIYGDKHLKKNSRFINACSSRKCKGSEKRKVIVLGIDKDYLNYGGNSDFLTKKLIYVACSRAMEELVIIYSYENEITSMFSQQVTENLKQEYLFRNSISVTDCKYLNFGYTKSNYSKRKLKYNFGDPSAAIGILLEIELAREFNLLENYDTIISSAKFRYLSKKEKVYTFIEYKNNQITLILKKGQKNNWPKNFDKLSRSLQIYVIQKVILLGVWKTDDIEILSLLQSTEEFNLKIKNLSNQIISTFGKPISYHGEGYKNIETVKPQRPLGNSECKLYYRLIGEYDFKLKNGSVLEIKYANPNKEHLNQVAMYSMISNTPSYLLNIYSGEINKISEINYGMINDPSQLIRAEQYIRYAKSLDKFKRVNLDFLDTRISCIDLETEGFPNYDNQILEMGGIITHHSGHVINLLDFKGDGLYNNEMFKEKANNFRENCDNLTHLKWGCDDAKFVYFDKKGERIIDVQNLYRSWRLMNDIDCSYEITLEHMCLDIFGGGLFFEAHCGYEDALMTLVCFYAMVQVEH